MAQLAVEEEGEEEAAPSYDPPVLDDPSMKISARSRYG